MILSEKIKNARQKNNMTQKHLAEELTKLGKKTSNTAIANWEAGLNCPDVQSLQLMCKILNKDANYFLDSKNNSLLSNIDFSGLDENDIKEIANFIEYMKNKKKS